MKHFRKKVSLALLMLLTVCSIASSVFAEGSKELITVNGSFTDAYRPYLDWRDRDQFDMASKNVIYVYANEGERVYFGSNVTEANDRSIEAVVTVGSMLDAETTLDLSDNDELKGSSIAVTMPTYDGSTVAFNPEGKGNDIFLDGSALTQGADNTKVYLFKPYNEFDEEGNISRKVGYIENIAMEAAGPNMDGSNPDGYEPLWFEAPITGTYSFRFLSTDYAQSDLPVLPTIAPEVAGVYTIDFEGEGGLPALNDKPTETISYYETNIGYVTFNYDPDNTKRVCRVKALTEDKTDSAGNVIYPAGKKYIQNPNTCLEDAGSIEFIPAHSGVNIQVVWEKKETTGSNETATENCYIYQNGKESHSGSSVNGELITTTFASIGGNEIKAGVPVKICMKGNAGANVYEIRYIYDTTTSAKVSLPYMEHSIGFDTLESSSKQIKEDRSFTDTLAGEITLYSDGSRGYKVAPPDSAITIGEKSYSGNRIGLWKQDDDIESFGDTLNDDGTPTDATASAIGIIPQHDGAKIEIVWDATDIGETKLKCWIGGKGEEDANKEITIGTVTETEENLDPSTVSVIAGLKKDVPVYIFSTAYARVYEIIYYYYPEGNEIVVGGSSSGINQVIEETSWTFEVEKTYSESALAEGYDNLYFYSLENKMSTGILQDGVYNLDTGGRGEFEYDGTPRNKIVELYPGVDGRVEITFTGGTPANPRYINVDQGGETKASAPSNGGTPTTMSAQVDAEMPVYIYSQSGNVRISEIRFIPEELEPFSRKVYQPWANSPSEVAAWDVTVGSTPGEVWNVYELFNGVDQDITKRGLAFYSGGYAWTEWEDYNGVEVDALKMQLPVYNSNGSIQKNVMEFTPTANGTVDVKAICQNYDIYLVIEQEGTILTEGLVTPHELTTISAAVAANKTVTIYGKGGSVFLNEIAYEPAKAQSWEVYECFTDFSQTTTVDGLTFYADSTNVSADNTTMTDPDTGEYLTSLKVETPVIYGDTISRNVFEFVPSDDGMVVATVWRNTGLSAAARYVVIEQDGEVIATVEAGNKVLTKAVANVEAGTTVRIYSEGGGIFFNAIDYAPEGGDTGLVSKQTGRVWMDLLFLNAGNYQKSFYCTLNTLTKDGFLYNVNLNGLQPYSFIFYSNNRGYLIDKWGMSTDTTWSDYGVTNTNEYLQPLEKSFFSKGNYDVGDAPVFIETNSDGTQTTYNGKVLTSPVLGNYIPTDDVMDYTHKVFLNTPDYESLGACTGNSYLRGEQRNQLPTQKNIQNSVTFKGLGNASNNTGEIHYGGLGVGGIFEINLTDIQMTTLKDDGTTNLSVTLDFSEYLLDSDHKPVTVLNEDTSEYEWVKASDTDELTDMRANNKVTLTAALIDEQSYYGLVWDGKDAYGNNVPSGVYPDITTTSIAMGVAHFPILDAEHNPNGIKIQLENPSSLFDARRDFVYYNNSAVSPKIDATDESAWLYAGISDDTKYPSRIGDGLNRLAGVSSNYSDSAAQGAMIFGNLSEEDLADGLNGSYNKEEEAGYGNYAALDIWTKYEVSQDGGIQVGIQSANRVKPYLSFVASEGKTDGLAEPFVQSHVRYEGEDLWLYDAGNSESVWDVYKSFTDFSQPTTVDGLTFYADSTAVSAYNEMMKDPETGEYLTSLKVEDPVIYDGVISRNVFEFTPETAGTVTATVWRNTSSNVIRYVEFEQDGTVIDTIEAGNMVLTNASVAVEAGKTVRIYSSGGGIYFNKISFIPENADSGVKSTGNKGDAQNTPIYGNTVSTGFIADLRSYESGTYDTITWDITIPVTGNDGDTYVKIPADFSGDTASLSDMIDPGENYISDVIYDYGESDEVYVGDEDVFFEEGSVNASSSSDWDISDITGATDGEVNIEDESTLFTDEELMNLAEYSELASSYNPGWDISVGVAGVEGLTDDEAVLRNRGSIYQITSIASDNNKATVSLKYKIGTVVSGESEVVIGLVIDNLYAPSSTAAASYYEPGADISTEYEDIDSNSAAVKADSFDEYNENSSYKLDEGEVQ